MIIFDLLTSRKKAEVCPEKEAELMKDHNSYDKQLRNFVVV